MEDVIIDSPILTSASRTSSGCIAELVDGHRLELELAVMNSTVQGKVIFPSWSLHLRPGPGNLLIKQVVLVQRALRGSEVQAPHAPLRQGLRDSFFCD